MTELDSRLGEKMLNWMAVEGKAVKVQSHLWEK